MIHTEVLDDRHSVTISSEQRRDGSWEATAEVFLTATCDNVGIDVVGHGSTFGKAEANARARARTALWRAARVSLAISANRDPRHKA